jgi:hypothetical protein
MAETDRSGRRGPEVRPSKFGAGYTVGGSPAVPPSPPPNPRTSEATAGVAVADRAGTGRHATVDQYVPPTPAAAPERRDVVTVPDAERNPLATVSLVLVVLFGAFLSPITLVMAHVARAQIKRTGERGAGLALAALVVSYVFLFIGLVVVAVNYASS